ncbi:unnamed protein product [Cladocopium goreaui]|uniref:Uncharacterized protein n=1 Tax=Cladocopium goreaui TaxID=2562237 RepID=A0A9P1FL00_9DINO|nr:unnamed protein product [Cladocopium goreaui]
MVRNLVEVAFPFAHNFKFCEVWAWSIWSVCTRICIPCSEFFASAVVSSWSIVDAVGLPLLRARDPGRDDSDTCIINAETLVLPPRPNVKFRIAQPWCHLNPNVVNKVRSHDI